MKEMLKFWVETRTDWQQERIRTGNRIGNIVYRKLEPDTWQKKKETDEKSFGKNYNYAEVKEKFEANRKKFTKDEQAEIETMFGFMQENKKLELTCEKSIKDLIKDEPIYKQFLCKVTGISHVLAGGLLAMVDIEKSEHVSSLWAYAGLSAQYVKAKCTEGHKLMLSKMNEGQKCSHINCDADVELVEEVKEASRRTAGYVSFWNPKLKTHCWKIGQSFLKTKGRYRELYEKFRAREDRDKPDLKPLHRQRRAMRKVVKIFLQHLWVKWRTLEGLPVTEPYCEAYLGHKPVPPPETKDTLADRAVIKTKKKKKGVKKVNKKKRKPQHVKKGKAVKKAKKK